MIDNEASCNNYFLKVASVDLKAEEVRDTKSESLSPGFSKLGDVFLEGEPFVLRLLVDSLRRVEREVFGGLVADDVLGFIVVPEPDRFPEFGLSRGSLVRLADANGERLFNLTCRAKTSGRSANTEASE